MTSLEFEEAGREAGFSLEQPTRLESVRYGSIDVMKAPRLVLDLALAIVIVGCGAGGASTADPSTPAGTIPSATGSASAAEPPSPSSPSMQPTTASEPAFVRATIDDPDLALNLSPSWRALPASTLRLQLEQASNTATGPLKAQMDQKLKDLDDGSIRLFAIGPSGFDPWQGTMTIEVFQGGSAVTRLDTIESNGRAIAAVTQVDRRNVTLSIGRAIRLSMSVGVPKGLEQSATPAQVVGYAIDLDDGRTLVIEASGPAASTSFATLIDTMVATIRPR